MKKKTFLIMIIVLLTLSLVKAQLPGSLTYDFRDGTIITNSQSDDGSLQLSGNYNLHGAQYGLNMKVNGQIKIAVASSSTFRFLGSKHSSLKMKGTAVTDGDLGTQNTKVINDLSDTYDFVYAGSADTIDFTTIAGTGNDLYLPSIEVIPAQSGANATSAVKNIIYHFDLRDGSIIPNETSLNGNYTIEKGLFKIESGPSNGYGYNGDTHGSILKAGNKITLQVAGNSTIKLGGCIYSNGIIAASSATGSFNKSSQESKATSEYHQEGTTIDFLYVGEAGLVTLEFTGTTYIPVIEIVPVPYAVELETWVKKSGTIAINGTTIGLTSGDDATSNATLTVSEGLVNSATSTLASIRINLGGKSLSTYTPEVSGDIASVSINADTLKITYANETTNPKSYAIVVADNSSIVKAEAGKTYNYNFANGSVLPQTSYQSLRYTTFITTDGILTLNSNSTVVASQYGYHDASHGAVFFPGNSIDMLVAGNATITFAICMYGSATDAMLEFTNAQGTVLGSIKATNISADAEGTSSFSYTGGAGLITATFKSTGYPTAEIYIHGMTIENAPETLPSNRLIDVWDFGAEQLDTEIYNNQITVDLINSWYVPTIAVGSSGNVLPAFSAGVLSWIGGGNDRLRTTNTAITRYDENIASVAGYTGRVYVNSGANKGRYMSLSLSEDDEVTIVTKTDAGGRLNFEYVPDPSAQTDQVVIPTDLTILHFVAKQEGTYHIFDDQGKPSYYRIYRKDANYKTLTGEIDLTQAANVPEGYSIVFTNEAGKSWASTMSGSSYSIKIPVGYSYQLSLSDANGYIISSASSLEVTDSITSFDVSLLKVQLFTVSGSVTGLGTELSKLELIYTPDVSAHKIFQPSPVINFENGTYSVQLEANCAYTLSANGVNDFYLPENTITIGETNTSANVVFATKPTYPVTIVASSLNTEQLAKLSLTFSNLNEAGYVYSFSSVDGIALRDGTYTIATGGLDEYPLELGMTSNLKVDGASTSKTLVFKAVNNWSFNDKVITTGTSYYKGLIFTGNISNEIAKGHLVAKPEATILVPVQPGNKITVTYYYSADFSIEGGEAYTTSSNSTSTLEYAEYIYTGTAAGLVTITVGSDAGTTYITDITLTEMVDYNAVIEVGSNKTYKTINEALVAVSKMKRENDERVTIMIDPGNYEEMLVVNIPNITLKNASSKPSIALVNKGVDIAEGAVRITSYYGHGYNYYSMGSDQKWNADLLRVNKENGTLSYANKGAGTTNDSYWNTTVLISANGFEAENIIFENSFNQYISKKESEDVVEMWESGGKGIRPTDVGNTAVQTKSFVERAAAIAIANNTDKVVLNKCRVVGHQDSFFGGSNVRAVIYKGAMMGGTDYIFGGMTAVFYQTDLMMNTSDDSNDVAYITAAQQSGGRGYLMYECTIKSAITGVENASTYGSKPGYFGRPWQATTSEVVFYNTSIETTNFPGSEGLSLIHPVGWLNSLGGESKMMYEYGTKEVSGANNQSGRASWSTILTEPTLTDGTAINPFNFTKGTDGWDPIADLIAGDVTETDFEVNNIVVGTVDSPEDYTCDLNLKWDADNVYLKLTIADDSIVSTGTAYQVDNIEVYFDMDNSKNIHWPRNGGWVSNDPTYDDKDFQFRLVPGVEFSVNNAAFTGATQVYTVTETGYDFDLTIPWDSLLLDFAPENGTQIGFDILASDNDATASDANRNQITLFSKIDKPYNDPSLFGTLQFESMGTFSIIPDEEVPGVASNLTATAVKDAVTIAWDNATDNIAILYYNVYQNGTLLTNKVYPKQTGNTLKISALADGEYTFALETVDNSWNVSATKATVTATVLTTAVIELDAKLSVYPNPVSNVLNIKGIDNMKQIEVISVTGSVMKKQLGSATINVSDLNRGVYFLKVQTDKEILTTRFMKD